MQKKIIAAFLFCCIICCLFAQNSGEIIGKLTDSLNATPLIGAGISLEQGDRVISQTTSAANGAFYFKPLAPGNYDLKISSIGYPGLSINNIYVSGTEITYLDLSIAPSSFEFEKAVVIEWEDEENIIIIPVLKPSDLKHSGDRSITNMVVKTVPTVYSPDGGDGGGIFIAGSRADATLYVIDGVRVDGSAFIPKSAIAEVAIYTSGIPAKYGDVTGGVIEITTKSFAGVF